MFRRCAFAVLFAAQLAAPAAARAALPDEVSKLLGAAQIPEEALGVLVLRGNSTLLAHGAGRSMQPASTMKLVTTMVGLELLGPTFRGRTELRTSAPLARGVLEGDLILRGGADADFTAEALERMLQSLRNQGIATVKGKLVLDRALFNPARPERGAAPFDEAPELRYNVIPDALLLNTNLVQIDLRSNDTRLQLAMQPALERVNVTADMTLVDADCARWDDGWKAPDVARGSGGRLMIVLHGSFPKNCAKATSINVIDRQDYVDRLFRATWRRLGGKIRGQTVEGVTPSDARVLAEHSARALPEIVRDINKLSDNALARTLFLSLGSLEADPQAGSRPLAPGSETTAARADLAVRAWMRGNGIADEGLVLENGSGLSRLERITPAQLAGLLQAALRSNWAPEFQSSLPIAAVDGTMRRRLRDSPAASRARLKTGMLKNVVAIAGYVPDANGTPCVVAAMINHDAAGSGAGRAVLDALIDWVARSGH